MPSLELHTTNVATIEVEHVVSDHEIEHWPSICSNLKVTLRDTERNSILVIRANTYRAKPLQRDAIKLVDKRQNAAENTNAK